MMSIKIYNNKQQNGFLIHDSKTGKFETVQKVSGRFFNKQGININSTSQRLASHILMKVSTVCES